MRLPLHVMIGAILVTSALLLAPSPEPMPPEPQPPSVKRILVFSKTAGFRHESIPAGIEAIQRLGAQHAFAVEATEDSAAFTTDNLRRFAAIVFLNTTGDVLDDPQQTAMEAFIKAGGGFVGVHSATDTEYEWEWYGRLVGAYFKSHPAVQRATIRITDVNDPSTRHLPRGAAGGGGGGGWTRTDEWYNFDKHPRARIGDKLVVLATLDESTYEGGDMGDHPFAWRHEFDGGRAWYTAGGHTIESYAEPEFLQHLLGGIQWAAGIKVDDRERPLP